MIDESLINAYRLAKYIVTYEDEEYRLQVGSTSEFVDHMLHHQNIKTAYFITPKNPFSCTVSEQENSLRHMRFREGIDKLQYFYLVGYGTDEAEKWPKESSYLIFTNDESEMHNLAARFGQNALLKISYKTPTQLLLLEPMCYIQS
ncbi:MAG: hypothetical protein ACI95X_003208 [Paraglaciecola sp.]|jgi:hypothetical protein